MLLSVWFIPKFARRFILKTAEAGKRVFSIALPASSAKYLRHVPVLANTLIAENWAEEYPSSTKWTYLLHPHFPDSYTFVPRSKPRSASKIAFSSYSDTRGSKVVICSAEAARCVR